MMTSDSKIYIIDDNETICDALIFLFNSFHNTAVEVYYSPNEFLKHFSPEWRGCIIIDLLMPEMNGIELTKLLKKIHSRIPVIIMSAHATITAESESLKAGASAFISKPFKTAQLLNLVTQLLNPVIDI